jgi:uncharacterized tellurite resistance protein B-like protein
MMPDAPKYLEYAQEFRHKATDCTKQASLAITQIDRRQWLRLAEHWLELAEVTDEAVIGASR